MSAPPAAAFGSSVLLLQTFVPIVCALIIGWLAYKGVIKGEKARATEPKRVESLSDIVDRITRIWLGATRYRQSDQWLHAELKHACRRYAAKRFLMPRKVRKRLDPIIDNIFNRWEREINRMISPGHSAKTFGFFQNHTDRNRLEEAKQIKSSLDKINKVAL